MTNKKLVAIGVNSETQYCCCIYSYATFKQLKENYNLYAKNYGATNWNGRDKIERTLELEKVKLTGNKFSHTEKVNGSDYDMGHTYGWSFTFDTIMEVKKETETKSILEDKNDVISKLSNIIEQEKANGKDTTILSNALLELKGDNNV